MGLCFAAGNEASAVQAQPESDLDATGSAGAVAPVLALLLPLASPDFARPAEAVRLGIMAAARHGGEKLSIGIFATDASSETILAGYERAVKRGARLIIGPMTRSGVSSLGASGLIGVPTLGLNLPEDKISLPPKFYTFGLSLEAEAQLVARSAATEFLKTAILVSAKTLLARRSREAFSATWLRVGGNIAESYEFGPQSDLIELKRALAKSPADLIFLAADGEQARRVRPFLNNNIPVFATSQVNSGVNDALANVDLNGIRFVDMPWLVQPDHPAAMVYPHPTGIGAEMERFYALGIDAFRIAAALLKEQRTFDLDGVTGRLTLYGNQVVREPVQAVFRNGAGVALDHDATSEQQR